MTNEDAALVISEFSGGGKRKKRIVLDLDQQQVRFEDCHTPRRWLSTVQTEYTCPASDILSVYEFRSDGRVRAITVVTREGKATLPTHASNFAEMRELLEGIAKRTPAGRATDHPMVWLVYLAAVLVGLVSAPLAVYVVGKLGNADFALRATWKIGFLMIGGALTSVLATRILIDGVFRLTGMNLVGPIAKSVSYAFMGLLMGGFVARRLRLPPFWTLAIPVVAGVWGLLVGVQQELAAKRKNGSRHDPNRG